MAELTELLRKASEGDQEAQNDLYRQTEPELRKLALHWIGRNSAKDKVRTTEVIDQAFLRLLRIKQPDWEHRGHFYAFALKNVLWALLDLLETRFPPLASSTDLEADSEARVTIHTLTTLQQALEALERELSETHRAIIELRYLAGHTLDETTELLSTEEKPLNRDAVFRMSRVAIAFLRQVLGPDFLSRS